MILTKVHSKSIKEIVMGTKTSEYNSSFSIGKRYGESYYYVGSSEKIERAELGEEEFEDIVIEFLPGETKRETYRIKISPDGIEIKSSSNNLNIRDMEEDYRIRLHLKIKAMYESEVVEFTSDNIHEFDENKLNKIISMEFSIDARQFGVTDRDLIWIYYGEVEGATDKRLLVSTYQNSKSWKNIIELP